MIFILVRFQIQLLTILFFYFFRFSKFIFLEKIQANTSDNSKVKQVKYTFHNQYYYMKFLSFIV